MRTARTLALAMLATLLAHAAPAQLLQDFLPPGVPGYGTEPGVTVVSRAHPDTEPPGIRTGAFVLHPALQQSAGFDDNVLAGPHRQGSAVIETQPSLLVGSDWARHAAGLYFSADDRRYLHAPAQSNVDWTVSLGGALDLAQGRLTLAAARFARHQDRSELDALPSDRPVAFRVDDLRASYAWTTGRWTLTPSIEVSAWHYDPTTVLGAPLSQAYRDRNELHAGLTLRYQLAPLRHLLLVGRTIGQHYTRPAAGQPSLDSVGTQLLAGFDYDANAVWRLRVLAGAQHRGFAAAAYRPQTAAIAEAELAWQPTGMTTVALRVDRSIEDAAQEGVAGFTRTSASLSLDHELRRDLLLNFGAGVQHADFPQNSARLDAYTLHAGATWLAGRHLRVSATFDRIAQHGGAAPALPLSGSFTRNRLLLLLRLGL